MNLYSIISAVFCMVVVVSNIISSKMVLMPITGTSIPIGVLTYPLTFLLSDLATELFGAKKAKEMVYMAMGTSILSFGIILLAILAPTDDLENQRAFQSVLGVNGLVIFASLTAYLTAQILDIQIYARIKGWTGERFLWMRNNGSTLLAQVVDTLIVQTIHLYWGLGMPLEAVLPIMGVSYCYKAFFSIANTPLFYLCVYLARQKRPAFG